MEGDPSSIIAPIIDFLLKQGWAGLIIAWLAWDRNEVQKRNTALNDRLFTVTEKVTEAMSASTASNTRLGDLILRGKLPE